MANRLITPDDLHADKGLKVLVIVTVFPTLAFIALMLRLYTRIKIIRNPALDDWFSTIAVIFSIATSICVNLQVQYGMGRHIQTLTDEQAMKYFKTLYACIFIYSFGHLFTKLSILLQYLRIATNRKTRLVCNIMIIFNIILGLEIFITAIFHCWPVSRFWHRRVSGSCIDTTVLWLFNTSLNIASDLVLLVLPMFILSASNLPRRRKILLWVILSSGSLCVLTPFLFQISNVPLSAAIISVWRLHFLYFISISNDVTWDNPGISIWACIELNTSIICSCVSTLKPLTSQFLPFIFRTVNSSPDVVQSSGNSSHRNQPGIGPSNSHVKKIDLVHSGEREPLKYTKDSSHVNQRSPEYSRTTEIDKEELIFTQLPNYPALVMVSTKT